MIETYLLEALVAFDEYKTLSSAAEQIHISQPALSRSMQKLEGILGVSLFDRSKNKITLNGTGKLAASLAKRILDQEDEMIQMVRNYDSSLHTISLGFCAPGPMMEVPPYMNRFYPRMAVSSEMKEEETLLEYLKTGRYNMIFLSHPVDLPGMICRYYGSEHLYISVIPAHPAAVFKDKGLHFRDVNGETFVMASEIGIWKQIVEKTMPDSRLIRQESMEALNEVVSSSSLPSFVTDLTIRLFRSGENSQRVFVPIRDPEAKVDFYCIYPDKDRERFSLWTNSLDEI